MAMGSVSVGSPGVILRAKNIILRPRTEWRRIADETTSLRTLLVRYVIPLATIAAIAGLIGGFFVTAGVFGIDGIIWLVATAAIQVLTAAAGAWVWGVIINGLAPTFKSQRNELRAFQLSAFAATGILVAGIAAIIPPLAVLFMVGGVVYSLVLLYLGLPFLMNTPDDQRLPYVLTLALIGLVMVFLVSLLYRALLALSASPSPSYTLG